MQYSTKELKQILVTPCDYQNRKYVEYVLDLEYLICMYNIIVVDHNHIRIKKSTNPYTRSIFRRFPCTRKARTAIVPKLRCVYFQGNAPEIMQ